ncbi:uncharacterized protein ccdc142 isoform X1 [Clupea harengus]|uniref:Uncharacterized protein ccdc142 isoform X1 n=2 Tax=Clupea harengus TaxID=7950 RepID=A0A6P8H6Q5_CLUHA|nr:uncharacterized protein ccdc142 isoform X1 [Clupea harengus]XP_031443353.1 uncharacterized protein ccdc142 isoform X1 [Clupea harengus]
MSLNYVTFQEGEKDVTQAQSSMGGLHEGAGHMETHACSEAPDGGSSSDDDLKRTGVFPEILSEDHLSRDSASWCQASLSKSLQRAEALLRTRLNPSLRWLLRQKEEEEDGGSWDCENENTSFVACQNLTSRSSARLQSLEQTVAGLRTQCHILWDGGRRLQPRGCVKGLSSSSSNGSDAYYHPQASAFGQHYGQLQWLLEERAKLIFLHEYAQRLRAAHCFVTKLSALLDHERLLLASRTPQGGGDKSSSSMWNLGLLRALSHELRGHLNHWAELRAKAHTDVYLRSILFWWKDTLCAMCQTFRLLGLQAVFLTEQCIHTALCLLAADEHFIHVPRDALEDLLASVQIFNHTVQEEFLHNAAAAWRRQHVILLADWPHLSGRLPRTGGPEPRTFSVLQLMKILAEQRGRLVAEQLYRWASRQSDLIACSGLAADWTHLETSGFDWRHLESAGFDWTHLESAGCDWSHPEQILSMLLSSQASGRDDPTGSQAKVDHFNLYPNEATHTDPQPCAYCTNSPFWFFVHRDCECLEILFQALVSSTDLLLSPPSKPGHNVDTTEALSAGSQRHCVRELQSTAVFENQQKSVHWKDSIKSDLCLELCTQYQEMLWREFSNAVIRCLFYKGHLSVGGSLNRRRDHIMFLLVVWLTRGFRGDFIPAECVDVMKGFCSQILYNTACMHWDEVICDALGYSLKDKCLPGAESESESESRTSLVRTATTERLVRLFNPLLTMLQHLKSNLRPGNDDRVAQLQILGALCRSVATVQSTTFWVMSKAYQFLSSWYLNKFLLVTQGDLVVLQALLKRLAQEVEDLNSRGGHPVISTLKGQFTRGVADLQAFSDRILRIFSMDCKRMSVEIFEQTMPSAKHWRINYKTELPSSPSAYATSAAQSVIGQVLEGVRLLPEDARIPALTEAMTGFMEAWMEHILKQKIKFSIQGALQLKRDFDLIRDLLGAEEYSLSEELHQTLLALNVFQQVDGAIVCLLQQPMNKPPYMMPSRAWEPFRHCCPSITQVDQAAGSLNNLDSMDVQAACQEGSLTQQAQDSLTSELVSASLPDSYLPLAQQEWLDLRIHNSSRWKLPGLHCFTRTES